MDIRQMRYFLAIAREGQITRAAKVLNMEQPPLSRQLKLMEQELNVTLFDRNGNKLSLTHAGELLQQKAEKLLQQFDEAIQEVRELEEGMQGMLSIGSVVSCISLLPKGIELFRAKYPEVTFKILEGDHFLLGYHLEKRNIELVVARLPFESASETNFSVLKLPSDPFVAVIPRQWSSDPHKETMHVQELAQFPLLTLKTDKTTGLHEKVMNECKRHGFEPQVICECSSVAIIMALVEAGIGITVFPKSVMASFPLPNIQVLTLVDADFQSEVGLLWLKDRYLSKSARHFIDIFSENLPL
ncbi:LysR family transcriptional regulator [Paenibacillus doosanensis]|uniref:HTH-type transcriptional regulator GltC n=1 Tax=Paenibacillus konkukensis TaxID=2020716 RepID=A0ABY4S1E4_9BACL|nr:MULTISPECIES: LysR family transcriptional regulator [Paenibacillus]MCS7462347.1 LysR family transcriptional regulator [Paenibacillus doosanensis]UQZ87685.1 HTH-type transcriptional regulator GltC [Paenibacillus konkukensis]